MGGPTRLQRGFWRLLHRITPVFITRKYNYTCDAITESAPCLIVSNHVTNTDPFFVGLAIKDGPPAYVASEHLMRLGLVSKLINALLAPIPRPKAASGAGTVKNCLKRLREGDSVVLFAEGDCTWDGLSHGIFPSTGKLVKASGAKLVTFRIEGGYLSRPRWSKKLRPMRMHGGPVRVYTPEELAAMTNEEVTAAIDRDIFEDAWARQREQRLPIASERRAEGLEQALAVCPKCGGIGTLASRDNTVFCRKCGMNAYVEKDGFFDSAAAFRTVAEWEAWQRAELKRVFANGECRDTGEPIPCVLRRIDSEGRRERPRKVKLSANTAPGALMLDGMLLPFERISRASMVKTERLLFTADDGYYELKSRKGGLRRILLVFKAAKGIDY